MKNSTQEKGVEKPIFDETHTYLDMGVEEQHIPMLLLLITSGEDLDLFNRYFWGKSVCQLFDILDFREYKLNKMKMDLARLEHLFGENPQSALEELTQRIVPKAITSKIVNGIANDKFTLTTFFDKFMENKDLSLTRILHEI